MPQTNWKLVSALPGISTNRSIDADGTALIGPHDARYSEVCSSHPLISRYLKSFFTPFAAHLEPTIIIRRSSLERIDSESLVRFRNIIAVNAILECWIKGFDHRFSSGPAHSDAFDIYPIHPSRDCDGLIVHTPHERALLDIKGFRGQPSPMTAATAAILATFDEPLLEALLKLYCAPPRTRKIRQLAVRVFHSLEIVYHATRAPFCHLGSAAEQGTLLASWVPAFEILAHPTTGDVKFADVSKLIHEVPWCSHGLRQKRYRPIPAGRNRQHAGSRPLPNTTFPVQVYGRLYRTRNHYFHGAPIREGEIEPRKRQRWEDLRFQVPALYRSVLLQLLASAGYASFPRGEPLPLTGGSDAAAEFGRACCAYYVQQEYERPLLPEAHRSR